MAVKDVWYEVGKLESGLWYFTYHSTDSDTLIPMNMTGSGKLKRDVVANAKALVEAQVNLEEGKVIQFENGSLDVLL